MATMSGGKLAQVSHQDLSHKGTVISYVVPLETRIGMAPGYLGWLAGLEERAVTSPITMAERFFRHYWSAVGKDRREPQENRECGQRTSAAFPNCEGEH